MAKSTKSRAETFVQLRPGQKDGGMSRPWKLFVKGALRGRFQSRDAAEQELNRMDLLSANNGKPRGWVLRHSQIVYEGPHDS